MCPTPGSADLTHCDSVALDSSTMTVKGRSPNQVDKRDQIIEAAKVVLLRDGLRGCTVREVAYESLLTRSAIHYYFRSMNEIIGAAMDSLLDGFVSGLRQAGVGIEDPVERFWAVMEKYVARSE